MLLLLRSHPSCSSGTSLFALDDDRTCDEGCSTCAVLDAHTLSSDFCLHLQYRSVYQTSLRLELRTVPYSPDMLGDQCEDRHLLPSAPHVLLHHW